MFAIVILSTLAGLYKSGHEEFVGDDKGPTPEEGKAVAGTIFTAVIVYAVRYGLRAVQGLVRMLTGAGVPSILRIPRDASRPREPKGHDCLVNCILFRFDFYTAYI